MGTDLRRGPRADGRFTDRTDAGRRLAEAVVAFGLEPGPDAPTVVALPRGGVPVGFQVAAALKAPLDVLVARKVGAPGRPEVGVGAVAEGGVRIVDASMAAHFGVDRANFDRLALVATAELERRRRVYRRDRPIPDLRGRTVVVVDDGIATGVTAAAALLAVRDRGAGRVVLAAPVGAPASVQRLRLVADDVVCPILPTELVAVGAWYDDFTQTTDDEVLALLDR